MIQLYLNMLFKIYPQIDIKDIIVIRNIKVIVTVCEFKLASYVFQANVADGHCADIILVSVLYWKLKNSFHNPSMAMGWEITSGIEDPIITKANKLVKIQ